jgi:hypothetical protein
MLTTRNTDEASPKSSVDETGKKVFVEPEISGPIDVLEATAFFQAIVGPVAMEFE